MVQLFFVLCGSRLIREKWWMLFLFGVLWLSVGGFLFIDALDGSLKVPLIAFTVPLAFDGAWALASFFRSTGVGKTLRLVKAAICFCIIIFIFFMPWYSGILIGFLVGFFLCLDAVWRGASALVIRHRAWWRRVLFSVFEFAFGAWAFVPWPSGWAGAIGLDVGTLLMLTGGTICFFALRIRCLPSRLSVFSVLNPNSPAFFIEEDEAQKCGRETAVVHVWTPTEAMVSLNRGISRYVAAVDKKGSVSTGHAALEVPPDVYISHYPAVEIDRSGEEFARILRGTSDNNVSGLFQPSYAEESAGWTPSTVQISLPGLNCCAIRDFWREYSTDTTYNLTTRNCASAVTKALDIGLDGLFAVKIRSPFFFLRLLLAPEFWVAGFMRERAAAMAWTPGIALDYTRALWYLVAVLGKDSSECSAAEAYAEDAS